MQSYVRKKSYRSVHEVCEVFNQNLFDKFWVSGDNSGAVTVVNSDKTRKYFQQNLNKENSSISSVNERNGYACNILTRRQ